MLIDSVVVAIFRELVAAGDVADLESNNSVADPSPLIGDGDTIDGVADAPPYLPLPKPSLPYAAVCAVATAPGSKTDITNKIIKYLENRISFFGVFKKF